MDFLHFVVTIILVTTSGALAPGPLFFATISHGTKSGAKSGFVFSVSHAVIEFSLIMLLALRFLTVANVLIVKQVIGIAGGCVLILFGAYQMRNSLFTRSEESKNLLNLCISISF